MNWMVKDAFGWGGPKNHESKIGPTQRMNPFNSLSYFSYRSFLSDDGSTASTLTVRTVRFLLAVGTVLGRARIIGFSSCLAVCLSLTITGCAERGAAFQFNRSRGINLDSKRLVEASAKSAGEMDRVTGQIVLQVESVRVHSGRAESQSVRCENAASKAELRFNKRSGAAKVSAGIKKQASIVHSAESKSIESKPSAELPPPK
jgi:hypothetical protein